MAGGGGDRGSPDALTPAPGEGDGDVGGGEGGGQEPSPQPGQLTAGEWRDLDDWDYWLTLMAKPEWSRMQSHWTFCPTSRRTVHVSGGAEAVVDAAVALRNAQGEALWESRTDGRSRQR